MRDGAAAPNDHAAGRPLFVLLRGDSHMRIVLNMFIMAVTRDKAVIKRAGYNKQTYHLPHLFSCPRSAGLYYEGCTLEIAGRDLPEKDLSAKVSS